MDRFASCLSFPLFPDWRWTCTCRRGGPTLIDEAPHNAKKVISASFSYHDKIADHEMLYRQYGCGCLRSRAVHDPTRFHRGGCRQVKDPCNIGSAKSF